jgi:hypothetical protein
MERDAKHYKKEYSQQYKKGINGVARDWLQKLL